MARAKPKKKKKTTPVQKKHLVQLEELNIEAPVDELFHQRRQMYLMVNLIAKRGPVKRAEMFKTFNMGLGLVIAVDPAEADSVMSALAAEGPCRAGEVIAGEAGVEIKGVEL